MHMQSKNHNCMHIMAFIWLIFAMVCFTSKMVCEHKCFYWSSECCLNFSALLFWVDALVAMEKAMKRDNIVVNDRQLACARISSPEGQDYLKGMAAAGNYAWVNRSSMTFLTRQVSVHTVHTNHHSHTSWSCLKEPTNISLPFRPSPKCSTPHLMIWTCMWSMTCHITLLKWRSTWWMVNRKHCWCIVRGQHGLFRHITP